MDSKQTTYSLFNTFYAALIRGRYKGDFAGSPTLKAG